MKQLTPDRQSMGLIGDIFILMCSTKMLLGRTCQPRLRAMNPATELRRGSQAGNHIRMRRHRHHLQYEA